MGQHLIQISSFLEFASAQNISLIGKLTTLNIRFEEAGSDFRLIFFVKGMTIKLEGILELQQCWENYVRGKVPNAVVKGLIVEADSVIKFSMEGM